MLEDNILSACPQTVVRSILHRIQQLSVAHINTVISGDRHIKTSE